MGNKKSYTPIKVLLGYVALVALVITVGWILYSENVVYSKLEDKIAFEKTKILKVSKLFSSIYKTESLGRKTIQTNSEKDFKSYLVETDSLKSRIDTLKQIVTTQYQKTLLDSVTYLLSEKTKNIQQLKAIKNKAEDEVSVNNAINEITRMESKLRKLVLKDFAKNPNELGTYQRNVLRKYVDYLNQNIPDDSTNTLSKQESDSILANSKKLLTAVKLKAEKKKESLNLEENKLLKNEIAISEQLRKVLRIIEREIIISSIKNNTLKEKSLKKVNEVVMTAAIIGLILTLLFSILIVSDYSKSQLYKKQLEIANFKTKNLLKSREQLISTVSHDLKTPLSTIVGYTELLGNSELTKKQQYFAKSIKGSSEYITKLVQDLLDFTQIEAGKITIEKLPFSLNDIIHEVAKSIQSVYEQKPIDLILEIDDKLHGRIIGDPFRLRQIITNIIGNAYKFTTQGFIKIEAKANIENQLITIKIEDTGIGVQEDKQQLIFEEFTQADESIEKSYGGTGLGLTISKKIIEILGGKLILNSVLGKGSVFEIQFPLLFDTSIPSEKSIVKASNDELTAVIIDDDSNLLNLTSEVLKQHNYKVFAFNNASAALEGIKSIDFDFVITDIQMPEIDGFLFLEKLKSAPISSFKNQPIIAVTGRTDLATEIYKDAGFAQVVNKPFSPNALLEVLNSIFNDTRTVMRSSELNESKINLEKTYSLDSLRTFLTNDEDLKTVLLSFMTSTKENLLLLKNGISEKNNLKIKDTVHRMGPMFKQVEGHEISSILDDLELKEFDFDEIEIKFKLLKGKITLLFLLLEKEIN